jgi:hypothetical protein|tara:strand:+ start:251 stop:382 length:132 start_codon:yes stop_codon:yes gene_type:complete
MTQQKHFGPSSLELRPLGCLRGEEAWLTRTLGNGGFSAKSFLG